jgi:hypothetical protein
VIDTPPPSVSPCGRSRDLAAPQRALLEKASLEKDSSVIASSWLDREYVLRNFRRYDREFAGFVDDGIKYLICSMVLSDSFHRPPPNAGFTIVADGGSSVVRVIFNAENRSVTKIECNAEG